MISGWLAKKILTSMKVYLATYLIYIDHLMLCIALPQVVFLSINIWGSKSKCHIILHIFFA